MRGFGHSQLSLGGKDIFLFLHTVKPPLPDQWASVVAAFEACDARNGGDITRLGFFVVTDGGTPDAQRRNEHSKFLRGRALPTAVVTDHALVRGVASAVDGFNPGIQVFAPQHVLRAVAHLGLSAGDLGPITDALIRVQAGMDPVRTLDAMLRFMHRAA